MNHSRPKPLFWGAAVIALLLLAYSLAAPPPRHAEAPASSADPDREQRNHVIQTAEAGTIRNELGSVIYGADDHAVHIVLDLDAVHYDQVGITFRGPDNHGVTFGDMTSSVKVGHVEYETTFVPVNYKLVLWTQLPIRILGEGREGWIEMTDKKSGNVILKEKLTFRN